MFSAVQHFEDHLQGFGDVRRLEYKSVKHFVDGIGKTTVHALALLFDGVGIYSIKHADGDNSVMVSMVAVKPESQGKGIGKRMLSLLCNWADRQELKLAAIAQQLELNGNGFTVESYAEMVKRDEAIGRPLVNEYKRNAGWMEWLERHFNFLPVPYAQNGEIIRFPKKRQ